MSTAAHRVLWAVIGLVLTALGITGILASYRTLPGVDAASPLLWSGLRRWWAGISPGGPILAAAVGLLLAVLGFRLLAWQVRIRSDPAMGELTVYDGATGRSTGRPDGTARSAGTPDGSGARPDDSDRDAPLAAGRPAGGLPGRTAVRAGVLATGLERDLARDHRVRRASVTLTGAAPEPEVWIRLHLGADAPLADVEDHVRAAVDRFARTSGLRPRHLDVTAAVDTARPARVR